MMIVWRTVICLVLVIIKLNTCQNVKTTLQALRPKGLRAGISVDANVKMLMFEGVVFDNTGNAANPEEAIGQIWGTGYRTAQGDWLFEDHDITLRKGQVIRYGIFLSLAMPAVSIKDEAVSVKFDGILTSYRTFTVTTLEDSQSSIPNPSCQPSLTKVRGRKQTCSGEIIFEDNFDSVLREDLWQVEQYIPIDHPEYPFVSYQKLNLIPVLNGTFVSEGSLYIFPRVQEEILKSYSIETDNNILSGSLNFTSRCTRKRCFKQAVGYDILPPVVSGRLTSSAFAFTYGTIHVRAKFPQGDWLYPEILLEPLFKKYGGQDDILNILKVAMSTGNRQISDEIFGSKILKGGPIMNKRCQNAFPSYTRLASGYWNDDFHVYSLRWTPDEIVLSVDDNQYARISLSSAGGDLTNLCLDGIIPDQFKSVNTYSFSDYYHITLGLAAGGVVEFPDTLKTGNGKPKPWTNHGQKASLKFWQDRGSWRPTWTRPELIVDYVRVVAL